jgi:hypothetical protein
VKQPKAMAYEKLFTYIDYIAGEYQRSVNKNNGQEHIYLDCLLNYGETVLSTAKFASQRAYWKNTIKRINPAFAEGYFKN